MSRSSLTLQVGVVLLAICLCDLIYAEDRIHRQKRGFRANSASRVAHGYGKRGYLPTNEELPTLTLDELISSLGISDGPLLTVKEFTQLLTSHPNLARALVTKFVDINGDDVITTEELFRPIPEK